MGSRAQTQVFIDTQQVLSQLSYLSNLIIGFLSPKPVCMLLPFTVVIVIVLRRSISCGLAVGGGILKSKLTA